MKIVLDFDDTVFNTHQTMVEFDKISEKAGFTADNFRTAYQGCKDKVGDFDAGIIADLLCEDIKEPSSVLNLKKEKIEKEINSILSRASEFVYPDFFDFVNSFDKKDLILISLGRTDFHAEKMKNSKVGSFFDKVIIVPGDKTEYLRSIYEDHCREKNPSSAGNKVFFVDDKADQIDKVKAALPQVVAIRMKRPYGGHTSVESKLADHVVTNLGEVREIILSYQ